MAKGFYGEADTPMPGYMTARSLDPSKRNKALDWIMKPSNTDEWVRPLRPGEKVNQREEPEAPAYRKGGRVKDYCKGGKVISSKNY